MDPLFQGDDRIRNMVARIIALLFTVAFFFLAPPVSAAGSPSPAPAASGQTQGLPLPATVSPTSPLYTDLLVNNLFHSFSCIAIGQSLIGQPCLTYQMTKNAQGAIQGVPVLSQVNTTGGVLGTTGNLIGMLYQNPPVRTVDYLASVSGGFGIVKEANAQVFGSGAAVLNPILKLWQVSRNISYVIMIVVFVIIGVMIMFRNKLNPQTVITAQAALPGLVIGLIMITFSYFFAGLISDMAFVGTNVVGYYFSIVQRPADTPQDLLNDMKGRNILDIFSPFTGVINNQNVADALASIWPSLENPNRSNNPFDPNFLDPSRVLTALASMLIIQLLMPFGSMFGGIGQIIVGVGAGGYTINNPRGTVSIALGFVATLILIYAMLRLLLRLVNNYLTIIFLTLSAPFQFLAASLPGRQGITTSWILNMLANILAFPAVLAVLYFIAYLLGPAVVSQRCPDRPSGPCPFRITEVNQSKQDNLMPIAQAQEPARRITNQDNFPLFGGLNLGFLELLLAFGALVALPSIPDIINRTIGRLGVAGQLIGQEMSGSTGAGRRYAGQFQQGVGGFAGQVGRVTDTRATQTLYNPNTQGFEQVPTLTEGQWSRARRGIGSSVRWIRNRF